MNDSIKKMTPDSARLLRIEVLRELAAELAHIAGGHSAEIVEPVAGDTSDLSLVSLPLADAAMSVLKGSSKPLSCKAIWLQLEKAGRESESNTPIHSVRWALKKRLTTDPDLIIVKGGQWHLKSKYSKAKLDKLMALYGGLGGESSEVHSQRTKAGIEARKKRGQLIGRPAKKMTEENIAKAKELLASGLPVLEVARQLGVSPALLYQRKLTKNRFGKGAAAAAANDRKEVKEAGHVRLVASNE